MRQESNHRMSNGEKDSVKISNSRARGVIVLIALLFLFQVVTFVWQKIRSREASAGEAVAGKHGTLVAREEHVGNNAFFFNPNTITQDSLVLLGFSRQQAASIIKYRTKGGMFKVKRDFAKMYVVDSIKYASLERYILLPDSLPVRPGRKKRASVVGTTKNVENSHGNATKEVKTTLYGTKFPKEKYVCNLNTADSVALVQLHGIGGYYAGKILRYREMLGGSFTDIHQLLEIEGFSQERFDKIRENIVVFERDVKKISLIDASMEFLRRHPYIGPYAARGIETFLRIKGRESFSSDIQLLEELVKERVIGIGNANKIREYLLHL